MTAPTATERLEAQAVAQVEFRREPLRSMLRRRLAADDQRRRREVDAASEKGDADG